MSKVMSFGTETGLTVLDSNADMSAEERVIDQMRSLKKFNQVHILSGEFWIIRMKGIHIIDPGSRTSCRG